MKRSFISLGTNLGNRMQNLRDAVISLTNSDQVNVVCMSSIYETDPVGYVDQGSFLNCVVEVETTKTADDLLVLCMEIEQTLGRVRDIRWGPRSIDLDILLIDETVVETEHLVVPHPRMHERGFVLVPLVEIFPEGIHPVVGLSFKELVRTQREGIHKWMQIDSVDEFVRSEN